MTAKTDRELLELAAKAAGVRIDKSPYNGGGHGNTGFDVLGNAVLDWHNGTKWNPLTDDGDALRLAVNLQLTVCNEHLSAGCVYCTAAFDWDGPKVDARWPQQQAVVEGDYAATRRAIVRAAAALPIPSRGAEL